MLKHWFCTKGNNNGSGKFCTKETIIVQVSFAQRISDSNATLTLWMEASEVIRDIEASVEAVSRKVSMLSVKDWKGEDQVE